MSVCFEGLTVKDEQVLHTNTVAMILTTCLHCLAHKLCGFQALVSASWSLDFKGCLSDLGVSSLIYTLYTIYILLTFIPFDVNGDRKEQIC